MRLEEALNILKNAKKSYNIDLTNEIIRAQGVKLLAKYLKDSEVSHTVNLYGNNISDNGVKYLGEQLKDSEMSHTVNLEMNHIRAKGLKYLGMHLKHSKVGHIINLSENKIGSRGAAMLMEQLKDSKVSHTIYIGNNYIGPEGIILLAKQLKDSKIGHTIDFRRDGEIMHSIFFEEENYQREICPECIFTDSKFSFNIVWEEKVGNSPSSEAVPMPKFSGAQSLGSAELSEQGSAPAPKDVPKPFQFKGNIDAGEEGISAIEARKIYGESIKPLGELKEGEEELVVIDPIAIGDQNPKAGNCFALVYGYYKTNGGKGAIAYRDVENVKHKHAVYLMTVSDFFSKTIDAFYKDSAMLGKYEEERKAAGLIEVGDQGINYKTWPYFLDRQADISNALTDSTEGNNEGSSTQKALELNIYNVAHVAMTVVSTVCQFQKDGIDYFMTALQFVGYIGLNKLINSVIDHMQLISFGNLKATSQVIPLLKHMHNTAVDCAHIFKGTGSKVNNTESSQGISDENELDAINMNDDTSSGVPLDEL